MRFHLPLTTLPVLWLCLVASILMVSPLSAQDEKPWSFSSNNSFYFFEGNTDKFDFYSYTEFNRIDSTYEFSADYRFVYGELNSVKNNLGHRGGVTYDYHPYNDFSPFAALSFLHNAIRGFDIKMNALAGLKYRYLLTESSDFSISAALMYEYVNFASPADPTLPEKADDSILRLSIRPKFKVEKDRFKWTNVTFYQPLIQDFADHLIESSTTFAFKVATHLDITINHILWYNSRPAYASVLKRDQQIVIGLNVSL